MVQYLNSYLTIFFLFFISVYLNIGCYGLVHISVRLRMGWYRVKFFCILMIYHVIICIGLFCVRIQKSWVHVVTLNVLHMACPLILYTYLYSQFVHPFSLFIEEFRGRWFFKLFLMELWAMSIAHKASMYERNQPLQNFSLFLVVSNYCITF